MSAASEVLAGRGSRTRSHQHQRRAVPLFRNHGAPTTRAATRRGTCSRLVAPTSAPSLASAEARSSGSRTAQGLAAPERPGRVASTRPRGTSSLTRRCSGLASLAAELHSLGHRGFQVGPVEIPLSEPRRPGFRSNEWGASRTRARSSVNLTSRQRPASRLHLENGFPRECVTIRRGHQQAIQACGAFRRAAQGVPFGEAAEWSTVESGRARHAPSQSGHQHRGAP